MKNLTITNLPFLKLPLLLKTIFFSKNVTPGSI